MRWSFKAGSDEHLVWLLTICPRYDQWEFENNVARYVMCDFDTPMAFSLRECGLEDYDNELKAGV